LSAGKDALATKSGCGGVTLIKEPYVKPEIKSEILEPEALCCWGSGGFDAIAGNNERSTGYCCEEIVSPFQ